MIDSDNYHPSTAHNSYSNLTILESKDKTITDETVAKVYTQDLKIKHEDKFLLNATTLSNLLHIKPKGIFTIQIILPPNNTFRIVLKRLLENTLCQISNYLDAIIFGGTILKDDFSDATLPYNHNDKIQPVDLSFTIGNIVHKVGISYFRFSHFGVDSQYAELLKIKDYALLKSDVTKSFEILDNINNIEDNTRYEYDLTYLCRMMHYIISKKKLNRIELLVKYKIVDIEDFNSFKKATEEYGYIVDLKYNKFIIQTF